MKPTDSNYSLFLKKVKLSCKEVYENYILRYAYGVDASCYNYTPKAVIKATCEAEIISILHLATIYKIPITFRAAGTSLSGQCSSDSILVIANKGWKNISIDESISLIECDCGVVASDANLALQKYDKKIGPDPATINTALIGGILNNNSSGMCCAIAENSYNTISSLRIILRDGTILDTSDLESINSFLISHKHVVKELLNLRKIILEDEELKELIKRKYRIKNTTGYGINSLLDFSDIKDIIDHIFIGSEGTLGFISKVRYKTVDNAKFKGCGLLFFATLDDASKAVVKLANMGRDIVIAAELMDYSCLMAVKDLDGVPGVLKECKDGYTCILLQSQNDEQSVLDNNLEFIKQELKDIAMPLNPLYSKEACVYDSWWKIRKAILPIVAGERKQGTTIITEDVCFTIETFCDGVKFLRNLFEKYDFKDGVIFGHALSGNLHFNITPDLSDPKDYENFSNLVKDMSIGVVKMGGSAKAEHGTGRMVAPFVEVEWGKKAYEINRKIKEIFDPLRILNPDVIISDDPEIYKKNLKTMPKNIINLPLESEIINRCMECGFCEKHCPSKDITLTPRQRISVLREATRMIEKDELQKANRLLEDYNYYGVETCASCSSCLELCPLGIDTANIAAELKKAISEKTLKSANIVYKNMDKVVNAAKFGLKFYHTGSRIIGAKNISSLTKNIRKISKKMPFTPLKMPYENDYILENKFYFPYKVVYFSACINRMFKPNPNGNSDDKRALQEVFESICKKANVSVIYPQNLSKLCCSKIFSSHESIVAQNTQLLKKELLEASQNGKYDIVVDHSSCFYEMAKNLKDQGMTILDMSEFLYKISSKLTFNKTDKRILIHKLCLLKKAKKDHFIENLAHLCSSKVETIKSFECCGFAGDKGFFTPELNQSSTKDLKIEAKDYDIGISSSSTCEIGLNSYSKLGFVNIAYLVDSAT